MTSSERRQRALEIAATTKLHRGETGWLVPSSTGHQTYVVDPAKGTCTCPDYVIRKTPCKHILAVEITALREGME